MELNQGDILKIERITHPVFIVSKNFFNTSGEIIGCPIYESGTTSPLHIRIDTDEIQGYVQCEKLALLDLKMRGHKKIGKVTSNDKMNIAFKKHVRYLINKKGVFQSKCPSDEPVDGLPELNIQTKIAVSLGRGRLFLCLIIIIVSAVIF